MSQKKKYLEEPMKDVMRRHRYGEQVGIIVNRVTGLVAHTVTQQPVKKGQGIKSFYDYEYYIHTNRRMIMKLESHEDLVRWLRTMTHLTMYNSVLDKKY